MNDETKSAQIEITGSDLQQPPELPPAQREKAVAAQEPRDSGDARQGIALLLSMLSRSLPFSQELDGAERAPLERAVVGLLQTADPQDGLEMMAASQLAALNLASLDSLGRAANCPSDSRARELNLHYGIKSTIAFTDLMKAIVSRRSQGRNSVSVGSVKLEPGAQAIIGNLQAGDACIPATAGEQQAMNPGQDGTATGAKPAIKSAA